MMAECIDAACIVGWLIMSGMRYSTAPLHHRSDGRFWPSNEGFSDTREHCTSRLNPTRHT